MGDSTSSRRSQIRRKTTPTPTPTPPFDINNLRDDLVQEILIRLPSSKEATRCKSVCKRWLSLISSDCFVTASTIHHRDNDDKNLLPFTLLVMRDRTNLECVEFLIHANRLSRRTTVDLGFLRRGNFGESLGFLYEPLDDRHNKYLVFRFLPRDLGDHYRFDVEIFSSDEGKWTRSVYISPQILYFMCPENPPIIACGRMLYTLIYSDGYIVAFDPFTNDPARLVRIIYLPDEARDVPLTDSKLGVCGGRLRFALIFQFCAQPHIRVWEVEDDYRMGKWRLIHSGIPTIHAKRNPIFRRAYRLNMISLLAFHPFNKYLICFLLNNEVVVVYNMCTNEVESSFRSSLFTLQDSPRPLVADVFPITQQYWWPTPV
ncbi:hypothetical protein HAX54_044185 [Datura stramonium]|uniref:F-box protein At3g26010-like beta-propeller domain-containing protein n=1 Tax=Datura stramonium TaxID=4076 RepID=A0ABS8W6R3_DATST|nr:hypothetical protein [Datura stramonium]